MNHGDSAPTLIRLDRALTDARSVVERLNDSDGRVTARIDRVHLVIGPSGPTLLVGVPAYWNGRPEFRGVLESANGDGLLLRGTFHSSEAALLSMVVGVAIAAMGVFAGVFILLSGDATGVLAVAFSLIVGAGIFAGATLIRRLSSRDEQTIKAVLRSISDEPTGVH
jgi:hypothetical protein